MKYNEIYGRNSSKRPPDLSRCAKSVSDASGWGSGQCSRKAVCDPDENGKFTTCKQHSELAKKIREEKSDKAAREKDIKRRMMYFNLTGGTDLLKALEAIAAGDNNTRKTASDALEVFKAKNKIEDGE